MKRSGFFFKTHHLSNLSKCFLTKDLSVQIYRNKRKTSALVIYISHLLLKNNAFKHFKLTSWILSLFLAGGSKIKSRHLIDGGPCSLSYQSKSISNEVYHHCCSWKKNPDRIKLESGRLLWRFRCISIGTSCPLWKPSAGVHLDLWSTTARLLFVRSVIQFRNLIPYRRWHVTK